MAYPFYNANACYLAYLHDDQLIYITPEEINQILKNYHSCGEGWLNWTCCKCDYLNGYAFQTCQFCKQRRCGA